MLHVIEGGFHPCNPQALDFNRNLIATLVAYLRGLKPSVLRSSGAPTPLTGYARI
ncbi:MAG: hypothetical protein ACO2O2_09465 [Acidilobaceae archaeon]